MAKFGIEQTGLSSPSLSGASFISQGVQDNSGAMRTQATTGLIQNVGQMGVEAYKGYQIADIERKQEALNTEYLESKNIPALAEQFKLEASQLETARANMFMSGASEEDVNPVTEKFKIALDKYNKAKDQGVMSPEVFHTRTLTILREAINRNPGLAKELSAQADKVLGLSGMTSLVKVDEQARESAQKQDEFLYHKEIELGTKFNTLGFAQTPEGGIDRPKLRELNAIRMKEEFLLEQAATKEKYTEQEIRQYLPDVANAQLNKSFDIATGILNDPKIPIEAAIFQIEAILDSNERAFLTDPRIASHVDKPYVQATLNFMREQSKAYKENIAKYKTKDTAAKFSANVRAMQSDSDYMTASKIANPQLTKMYQDVTSNLPPGWWTDPEYTSLKVQGMTYLAKIGEGLQTNMKEAYEVRSRQNASLASATIDILSKHQGSPKEIEDLSKSIITISKDVPELPTREQFEFNADYIKKLGDPRNTEGLKNISDEARNAGNTHIKNYTTPVVTELKEVLKSYSDKGVKIYMDALPDGRISIHTDIPQLTQELNRKYIPRINESMKAYSNVNGFSSTNEGSKKFFSEYRDTFTGKSSAEDQNVMVLKQARDILVKQGKSSKTLDEEISSYLQGSSEPIQPTTTVTKDEEGPLDKKVEDLLIKSKKEGASNELIAQWWRRPIEEVEAFFKKKEEEIKASMRKTTGR